MKKRLMCMILSILMLVSLLPMGALAADSGVASATIGETTEYYASVTDAVTAIASSGSGTLTIYDMDGTDLTVESGVTITLDLQNDYYGDITIENGGTLI